MIGTVNYMKRSTLLRSLFISLALSLAVASAFGQDGSPNQEPVRPANNFVQQGPELLRQLGLTQDQVQKIRRLNMARKPLMDEAQRKHAEANRALDEAIYSDEVNDETVAARIKDVQLAQAEIIKIRSMSEFAIRRILTTEQLVRFRELQRRFAETRERIQQRRGINGQNEPPVQDRQNLVRPVNTRRNIKP